MPSYDYTCQYCGHTWLEIQRYDEPAPKCPDCKSKDTLRHFPSPAVHVFYSPCHPRHKRGMCGNKTVPITPQFRDGKGPKKKQK